MTYSVKEIYYTLQGQGTQPERFVDKAFSHFYLQPMDGADSGINTQAVIQYCLGNPHWKLSLQPHKLVGIP